MYIVPAMRASLDLGCRSGWIFDMDGTLTVAMHDFDAIRAELGMPLGQPILEEIAKRPEAERARLMAELHRIELALAREARAAEGAVELLELLRGRGLRLGILTRNSHANALTTLAACGLGDFFPEERVCSREHAPPKPDPAGIHRLLGAWNVAPGQAVMVGDYKYDLLAGRAAGTATVYVDPSGAFPFAEHADVAIAKLAELGDLL